MGPLEQAQRPQGILTALLAEKGYRDVAVRGPFIRWAHADQFTVAIHGAGGVQAQQLRGTFEELREQIRALPQG